MTIGEAFFGRAYERRSPMLEGLGAAEHRRRLLAGLTGRVVEVGAGNGLNFSHLPGSVQHYAALDPNRFLLSRARARASARAGVVSLVAARDDRLPFDTAAVDAVVCSLVLCSVPSVERALAEIRRVLRPGGELRFYEHGVASDRRLRRMQMMAEPLWRLVAGGCRPTRDPLGAVQASGFSLQWHERFDFRPRVSAWLTEPHVLGTAVRR